MGIGEKEDEDRNSPENRHGFDCFFLTLFSSHFQAIVIRKTLRA